jgi:hypothetical protein
MRAILVPTSLGGRELREETLVDREHVPLLKGVIRTGKADVTAVN